MFPYALILSLAETPWETPTPSWTVVDFKKLPGELTDAVQFLKQHVKGQVKTKGNQIQLDKTAHKEVRLLLHKYLHHKSIEGYRVLSRSGIFEIAPLHHVKMPRREEGTPPPASSTLPYLFPNAPALVPEEKKASKKKRAARKKN